MIKINSFQELLKHLQVNDNNYVLIYKKDAEQSKCAFNNITEIDKIDNINLFSVNVAEVKDVHTKYNIKSAPTLLQFEKDQLKKAIKGCNSTQYYKSLFENSLYSTVFSEDKKTQQKSVTVYSTPTCSWCNRLKEYLKKNKIKFKDIDVSKDRKAAEKMVKRSGQQGVPQTNIAGQIIIGFDKKRIDQLLEIKTQ